MGLTTSEQKAHKYENKCYICGVQSLRTERVKRGKKKEITINMGESTRVKGHIFITLIIQAIPWPMVFDMGLGNSRHDRPFITLLSQLKDK